MDDGEFTERLRKLYEDHARVISLIESMPPPTEAQKKEVRELIATQKREYDEFYERQAEEDRKASAEWQANEDGRRAKHEADPAYWKRLYLGMVEREERRQREREILYGLVVVSAIGGAIILVLKFLFHI